MDREESIKSPKTILQAVVLILPTLALIVMQPNLSTTICVAALFCALLYIAGLSYKIVGPALLILIPAVIIFLTIAVQPNQPLLKDYQQKRILAWLEPEKYTDEDSYQQLNSVKAIGSGSFWEKDTIMMKLLPLKMETLYQSLRQILFLQLLVKN